MDFDRGMTREQFYEFELQRVWEAREANTDTCIHKADKSSLLI